jgi:hypothetical protein
MTPHDRNLPFPSVLADTSMTPARNRSRLRGAANPNPGEHSVAPRTGVVWLEFLLIVPILLIVLLAAVQFGLLLANLQHVHLAAFSGAKLAASLPPHALPKSTRNIEERANRVLQTAGLGRACRIKLVQNVSSGRPALTTRGTCDCPQTRESRLPGGRRAGAVRVTVYVPLAQLTPDLLSSIGISLGSRLTHATVTLPHVQ